MQNRIEVDEEELIKGSNNFTSFIHAYTIFIMNFFKSTYSEAETEDLLLIEEQVTQSLLLLEKLHMFIFMNIFIYKKHFTLPENSHPLINETNLELLEKLQMFINQYNFLNEENRIICEQTIFQIITYYYNSNKLSQITDFELEIDDEILKSDNVTFTFSPLPPPWLASLPSIQ